MSAPRHGQSVDLAGSCRNEPADAQPVGDVADNVSVVVRVYLKSPAEEGHQPGSAADLAALAVPTSRRKLARERAQHYAPALAALAEFAAQHRLTVRTVQPARRCVVLAGKANQMARAFGASLRIYDDGHRRFRARSGWLKVPAPLAPWTRAVLGFDHRPQARVRDLAGEGGGDGLWPSEVAALYGIPLAQSGPPQCIGVIALGGGYLPGDISAAAQRAGRPVPTIVERSVDGAVNQYGGGTAHDEEIALDLQVLAGILPSPKLVVYFAQNTAASLAAAIHQAVFDDVNRPTAVSISWGSAEKFWSQGPRDAVQAALADAVRLKVSITAASGDLLATGGLSDGAAHVFFPASSPYALGCGGTNMTLQSSAIVSEQAWKDNRVGTGGGISDVFPVPDYQLNMPIPPSVSTGGRGRGVPDVAAAAAGTPGYRIILDGEPLVKDGTSAVAPLWAALIALANAQHGAPLGFINPLLYAQPDLFRAIEHGDNRVGGVGYEAHPGLIWNACTGLGAPKGAAIIAALGEPQVLVA